MTRAAARVFSNGGRGFSNARRERTAPFSNGRFYFNDQHPSVYRSVARRNTKECHALCRVRSFGTAECEHAELARLR